MAVSKHSIRGGKTAKAKSSSKRKFVVVKLAGKAGRPAKPATVRGGYLVTRATRVSAPKTQTRATEMLEIVGRIADWAGGELQAMAWYRAEPIAAFGGRTAESLLFQMSGRDPIVFAGATIVLVAVSLFAGLIPAQRAARVDPIAALREG